MTFKAPETKKYTKEEQKQSLRELYQQSGKDDLEFDAPMYTLKHAALKNAVRVRRTRRKNIKATKTTT